MPLSPTCEHVDTLKATIAQSLPCSTLLAVVLWITQWRRCMIPAMASPGQDSESLNIQLLVDSIPALIHTARPDGYLDYFNKPWLRYGARHLKRAIERFVVYPLARFVATDHVNLGDVLFIDRHSGDDGLTFLRDTEKPPFPAETSLVGLNSRHIPYAEVRG